VILPNDLDAAVEEIAFIAKAGLRGGVLLPLICAGRNLAKATL